MPEGKTETDGDRILETHTVYKQLGGTFGSVLRRMQLTKA